MHNLRGKRGFKIIEILTVTVIAGVIIAVAIPNALRSRINANESYAQEILKTIARGIEEYAHYNRGNYPTSISYLTAAKPAYLNEDYTASPRNGYIFSCSLSSPNYYNCTATPLISSNKMYSVYPGLSFTKKTDAVVTITGEQPPPDDPIEPPDDPIRPLSSSCFLSGTSILLSNGKSAPIESLKVGDEVMAFDEKSGLLKPDKVKETFKHTAQEYLIVNGYLKATSNHPVYSNGKWVEVGTLRIGDKLLNAKGQPETVTSLRLVKKQAKVYNLEVNPYHTYIASGLVVHNKAARVVDDDVVTTEPGI